MIKISIVVPVYNVEKYLDKCLDSLVNQTLKEIEIIVVNDGTKDNSQQIIDKYQKEYPDKITALIKENGGLSDARNFGVPYTTGEYLAFLDSDDYVELDLYENMYKEAKKIDADLVVADIEYVWENNDKNPFVMKGLNQNFKTDFKKQLFLSPLFAWNKLYRRSLFEKLDCKYPLSLWYEDIPVTLRYFASSEKIGYYNEVGFHYLQRQSSILGSGYNKKMFHLFEIFDLVTKDFKEASLFEEYRDEIEYLYIEHILLYGAFRFLRTDHYTELMTKAFSFVENEFPQWKKNRYFKELGFKNKIFLLTDNPITMSLWHKYLSRG